MSFDDLLIHELVIYRNVPAVVPVHDPAGPTDGDPILDDWGQPTYGASVLATVDGRIRPRGVGGIGTSREVALTNQGGVVVCTHICDLYPVAGITTACWVVSGGIRYDITGIVDPSGAGHHQILDLTEVG